MACDVVTKLYDTVDQDKTRFFFPDGEEMLFLTEKAINADFGNVFQWAQSLGLSGRVAFRMFGKYTWMTSYKVKRQVLSAMHQRIIEAAFQCGYATQLKKDRWL